MMYKFRALLGLSLLISVMSFAFAQTTSLPFAADVSGKLVYDAGIGSSTEVIVADHIGFLAWNPDNTVLAFIKHTQLPQQNDVRELGIADFSAEPFETIILQTHRPAIGYNVSWMRDGRILFAAENPQSNPETGLNDKIDLFASMPGEDVELLGTFTFLGECGGGSQLPADWRYWIEIGGMDGFRTLADTPYGILYSTDCAGSRLALLDPETGMSRDFIDNFVKAVVSPDGEFVAGLSRDYSTDPVSSQLTIIEISTGVERTIPTEAEPNLLTWDLDGDALYYATRQYDGNLLEALSATEREEFDDGLGYELESVPANSVGLYQFNLTEERTSRVYYGDAYAIGRIIDSEEALYLSQVPNMGSWIEKVRSGEISVADVSANLNLVHAEVIMIEKTGSGFGADHLWGHFDLFTPAVHK